MSDFQVLRTNHTSFTVSDLDRSIALYAGVLGFELEALFDALSLHAHLSPTRSNGLHGMVKQVMSRVGALAKA